MTSFQGKRVPDNNFPENPGEYAKIIGDHEPYWLVQVPTGGGVFFIGRPNADGSPYHRVEENEDGTITVRANPPSDPNNSNSIKYNHWHGYIEGGVWNGNYEE